MSEREYNILMVEDNINHFKILQRFIKKSRAPINVDQVNTAQECFNIFLKKNYDLLILDYNLEQYTGIQILERLNQLQVQVPIIMVTQQKDPKIAIKAMKLGAVDFIYKSKESFKGLPKQIIEYINDFEFKVINDEAFKSQRSGLLKNNLVQTLMENILETKHLTLKPRSSIRHSFTPDYTDKLEIDDERLEKILQLLTLNRILIKKPVGVKITCPKCDLDDVQVVPKCPICGGILFVKNSGTNKDAEKPFRCIEGCHQAFNHVKITHRCNGCGNSFDEKETTYKHTFTYEVNEQIIEELRTQIKKGKELSHWEKRNQQITEDLENTKNMQQEIRSQLRQFIKQQIKNK